MVMVVICCQAYKIIYAQFYTHLLLCSGENNMRGNTKTPAQDGITAIVCDYHLSPKNLAGLLDCPAEPVDEADVMRWLTGNLSGYVSAYHLSVIISLLVALPVLRAHYGTPGDIEALYSVKSGSGSTLATMIKYRREDELPRFIHSFENGRRKTSQSHT